MSAFRSYKSFENFASSVKHNYRYIHTTEAKDFLDTLLETSKDKEITLEKGKELYRSQRGYDEIEEYDQGRNTLIGIIDLPYKASRMIPDAEKSRNGRVNPNGIPCLYLADDLETALSEARPWIKERVSVAVLKVKRNLKVINFSNIESRARIFFKEPPDKIKEQEVWARVNRAFSQPVYIDDQDRDYIPTQVISELFKSRSFDGLKYKSMLASGNNYALFNLKDAIPIKGVIFEVNSIKYQFDQPINFVEYSIDGSDTRTYNKIITAMPVKEKENET